MPAAAEAAYAAQQRDVEPLREENTPKLEAEGMMRLLEQERPAPVHRRRIRLDTEGFRLNAG